MHIQINRHGSNHGMIWIILKILRQECERHTVKWTYWIKWSCENVHVLWVYGRYELNLDLVQISKNHVFTAADDSTFSYNLPHSARYLPLMTIFIGDLFDPFGRIPADWMIHKSFSPLSSYFHVFIPHYFFVKLKIEICPKLGNSSQGTCCKMKKSSIMIIHVIMLKLRLFGFNNLNAVYFH